MSVINYKQFDYDKLKATPCQKRKAGNPATKDKSRYKDIITAFDIETTNLDDIEQSIMYIWQWQFGNDCTVVGRTWREFKEFTCRLKSTLKHNEKLVVFCHNLSFEFQFLRGVYDFAPSDVFAVKSRKILKATMLDAFEFRCSYLHSNMSLKEYTEKMGAEHSKLSGKEFDYSIKRYPWTKLTAKELDYCIYDVMGLVEAIQIDMARDNDSLYTFPLTSTGYVRRDVKRAMKSIDHNIIKKQCPDFRLYKLLRSAFRGGNTHANRFFAGKVITDVSSADRSSSYPDVLVNCLYPVTAFENYGPMDLEELQYYLTKRNKAALMQVVMEGVKLRRWWWGCPYLSKDKCTTIGGIFDNGRILEAEYLETVITDIDLDIILSEYEFTNIIFKDVNLATYGPLPKPFTETIKRYYTDKTRLKGIEGQELYYNKSKALLNSLYGMAAQDPVKQTIEFTNGEFVEREDDPEELLNKYNRKAFVVYQWGVWCTAWARLRLEEGIRLAGKNFVYCDTDSVKYCGDIDWSKYNSQRQEDSIKSGAYATDPKGITHYMGVYEFEGVYQKFATLGAKKYVSEDDGKIHLTVAGVGKKDGAKELEKAGGIEKFKQGFIFKEAGGTELKYNDNPSGWVYADGHRVNLTANVYIHNSTYTLGITDEYDRLLENAHKLLTLNKKYSIL